MAVLYLTELNAIGGGGNHPVSGGQWPPVTEQVVNITGASVQSAVLNNNTTLLRINVDAACSIAIGPNPIATVIKARLAANQTEYFSIPRSLGYQVAVISNT